MSAEEMVDSFRAKFLSSRGLPKEKVLEGAALLKAMNSEALGSFRDQLLKLLDSASSSLVRINLLYIANKYFHKNKKVAADWDALIDKLLRSLSHHLYDERERKHVFGILQMWQKEALFPEHSLSTWLLLCEGPSSSSIVPSSGPSRVDRRNRGTSVSSDISPIVSSLVSDNVSPGPSHGDHRERGASVSSDISPTPPSSYVVDNLPSRADDRERGASVSSDISPMFAQPTHVSSGASSVFDAWSSHIGRKRDRSPRKSAFSPEPQFLPPRTPMSTHKPLRTHTPLSTHTPVRARTDDQHQHHYAEHSPYSHQRPQHTHHTHHTHHRHHSHYEQRPRDRDTRSHYMPSSQYLPPPYPVHVHSTQPHPPIQPPPPDSRPPPPPFQPPPPPLSPSTSLEEVEGVEDSEGESEREGESTSESLQAAKRTAMYTFAHRIFEQWMAKAQSKTETLHLRMLCVTAFALLHEFTQTYAIGDDEVAAVHACIYLAGKEESMFARTSKLRSISQRALGDCFGSRATLPEDSKIFEYEMRLLKTVSFNLNVLKNPIHEIYALYVDKHMDSALCQRLCEFFVSKDILSHKVFFSLSPRVVASVLSAVVPAHTSDSGDECVRERLKRFFRSSLFICTPSHQRIQVLQCFTALRRHSKSLFASLSLTADFVYCTAVELFSRFTDTHLSRLPPEALFRHSTRFVLDFVKAEKLKREKIPEPAQDADGSPSLSGHTTCSHSLCPSLSPPHGETPTGTPVETHIHTDTCINTELIGESVSVARSVDCEREGETHTDTERELDRDIVASEENLCEHFSSDAQTHAHSQCVEKTQEEQCQTQSETRPEAENEYLCGISASQPQTDTDARPELHSEERTGAHSEIRAETESGLVLCGDCMSLPEALADTHIDTHTDTRILAERETKEEGEVEESEESSECVAALYAAAEREIRREEMCTLRRNEQSEVQHDNVQHEDRDIEDKPQRVSVSVQPYGDDVEKVNPMGTNSDVPAQEQVSLSSSGVEQQTSSATAYTHTAVRGEREGERTQRDLLSERKRPIGFAQNALRSLLQRNNSDNSNSANGALNRVSLRERRRERESDSVSVSVERESDRGRALRDSSRERVREREKTDERERKAISVSLLSRLGKREQESEGQTDKQRENAIKNEREKEGENNEEREMENESSDLEREVGKEEKKRKHWKEWREEKRKQREKEKHQDIEDKKEREREKEEEKAMKREKQKEKEKERDREASRRAQEERDRERGRESRERHMDRKRRVERKKESKSSGHIHYGPAPPAPPAAHVPFAGIYGPAPPAPEESSFKRRRRH